ncbi:hypothetical protein chiPu_0028913, partial [Chiloscyllium punctatum]|nr:hypothetical protein [Chiloscyllium punctatum]
AVERADAGADHHVGDHAMRRQCLQHADLDRAKAAAAGKHKGGLRCIRIGDGQGAAPWSPRSERAARRWGEL